MDALRRIEYAGRSCCHALLTLGSLFSGSGSFELAGA